MANTISLSAAITSTRETVTITDGTTFSDPVRASVNVYFASSKVDYDENETVLTITSDDSDPGTDSTWSYSYSNGDGYYKMRYIEIDDYNVATTYALYDAVNSGGVVYRSKSAGNVGNAVTNTTYWEVISSPTSLCDNKGSATESLNANSLVYERVFTSNAQYGYGNCVSQNSMHTESDDEDILHDYDIFSIMINGAVTADERTEVLSGELICRKIESRFSKYIDE